MAGQYRWQSRCSALMSLGIIASAIAPLITSTPSLAQTTFSDVQSDYWAASFIQQLSQKGIIAGFGDGTFHPNDAVTRAQFAAMINKAFSQVSKRNATNFTDVATSYWAANAIGNAYTTGFLTGYPGNIFKPNQNIPRQQVLVSLANGLGYTPSLNTNTTLQNYSDASNITDYARSPIAAATEKQIVVNYPNVNYLNPTRSATRAEVAAFIYQALVSNNQASAISSPYIVAIGQQTPPTPTAATISQGTVIPVKYDKAKKILLSKDEKVPVTLTVSENVVANNGAIVIPAGSQVVGQLQPVQGGSQFLAQTLVLGNGQQYPLNGTSSVITKTERITKGASVGTIVQDSVLGAGAAAAVSAVTGNRNITVGKVLGGVGIGGLIGLFFGKKQVDLIAVDPNTDLQVTVNQNLQISQR